MLPFSLAPTYISVVLSSRKAQELLLLFLLLVVAFLCRSILLNRFSYSFFLCYVPFSWYTIFFCTVLYCLVLFFFWFYSSILLSFFYLSSVQIEFNRMSHFAHSHFACFHFRFCLFSIVLVTELFFSTEHKNEKRRSFFLLREWEHFGLSVFFSFSSQVSDLSRCFC